MRGLEWISPSSENMPTVTKKVVRGRRGRVRTMLRLTLPTVVAAVVVAAVLFLPQPIVQMRSLPLTPKERLEAEAGIRGALIQLLGGSILVVGLYFTARGFRLTREGHITDRYTKAIEQLGNQNADVRIGGIYALERIARDSTDDRATIIDVLATFAREHTKAGHRTPSTEKVGADVQAALSVLGRRFGADEEKKRLDLYHSGLSDADLSGGDFRNAMFDYSRLDGASFSGATLTGADLSFCRARGAAFTHSQASGAHFVNAEYTHGWFLAADLTDTDFYGCDLTNSDFGRRYAELGDPPLPPATLTRARLTNAKLAGTILRGVDLRTVRGLTPEQLKEALTDENTLLPVQWRKPEDDQ
jgi:uncharacterized protein YjbI with pentapeptide repeats